MSDLTNLPRTRPPGFWATNFTDAQLRRALDPEPTEDDELIRIELDRRAKLPVVANPAMGALPDVVLRGWGHLFDAMVRAAQTFDELYAPSRALEDVVDELASRDTLLSVLASSTDETGHAERIGLFDAWES